MGRSKKRVGAEELPDFCPPTKLEDKARLMVMVRE